MTVRDERAAALIRRHRDLADDFTRALVLVLDDLEAIDAAHAGPRASEAGPKVVITLDDGTVIGPSTPVPPPAGNRTPAARPATRRRTTR